MIITEQHAHQINLEDTLPEPSNVRALTLIAETDGGMLPIRYNDPESPDARKGKKLVWCEAKTSIVRREGEVAPLYTSTIGTPEEAGIALKAIAKANGLCNRTYMHCLGDGAVWIEAQVRKQFGSQAHFLLDIFHVCEYLSDAAKVIVPESPASWVSAQVERLKAGKSDEAIMAINREASKAKEDKDGKNPIIDCLGYLAKRHNQLDYLTAIEKDLPIGSGEIESAHRHLMQSRMKRPGAWWVVDNAKAMLNLRAMRANGQWEPYWQNQRKAA